MAKGETYEEFVAKFKKNAPKTTDDCYTPQPVYEVVKEYALKLAGLTEETCTPVRPFYPGGDYRNCDYPADAYVIDNPPFSILSEIRRWYIAHGIKYFLFAPSLTSINPSIEDTVVLTHACIIYTNGAQIRNSFVTNTVKDYRLVTAPDLKMKLEKIFKQKRKEHGKEKKQFKKYVSPKNTFTARDVNLVSNTDFKIKRTESAASACIGNHRQYGGLYLISDRAAAELEKARAAAELEKARAAAEKARAEMESAERLQLSPEQLEIVAELNRKNQ